MHNQWKAALLFLPLTLFSAPSDDYVIKVQTDNPGASNNNEFTIPVIRTSGNGYNVDCNNDGTDEVSGATTTSYPDGYTCVYASTGTYTVRVKDNNGDGKGFQRIRFYINSTTTTDVLKLLEINQWGTALWSSMYQAYRDASNLTITPTDIPDLSNLSSLGQMFQSCTNADIKTADWNTSTITNISAIFRDASTADPDVSGWNTSSVTKMNRVFYNANSANPDVGNWDTSQVTEMTSMFRGAVSATPDTSGWNTAQVTKMNSMFHDASNADPDVSGWDTSEVTTMFAMFKNAAKAVPDTASWNTSNVTTMRSMFEGASLAKPDVTRWDVSNVTSMLSLFKDASHADPDVTNWNVSSVTTMSNMFQNAVSFDRNLEHWDVSNVTSFINFLSGAKLSTYHYDALLKEWANLTLSDDERFDAGDSTYCSGETARISIIDNYNWDIRDAGKNCPAPCAEVDRPLSAMHWTLVSFPCNTGSNGVEALLGNALGVYGDDNDWVMYEQTGANDYIGNNTQKRILDSNDTVIPGKGYWIIVANDTNMTIDTTLPDLNYTAVQASSNLGISSTVFDDVNLTQLPDSDANNAKKVILGNPFPIKMQLSDLYFSHGGGSGSYNPLGDSSNDSYINTTVYTYDHAGTSANNYIAVTPDTPGFTDRIDPMTAFWIKLESGQTGSNFMTFPLEN